MWGWSFSGPPSRGIRGIVPPPQPRAPGWHRAPARERAPHRRTLATRRLVLVIEDRFPIDPLPELLPLDRKETLDELLGARLRFHHDRVVLDLEVQDRALREAELLPDVFRNHDLALRSQFALHSNLQVGIPTQYTFARGSLRTGLRPTTTAGGRRGKSNTVIRTEITFADFRASLRCQRAHMRLLMWRPN